MLNANADSFIKLSSLLKFEWPASRKVKTGLCQDDMHVLAVGSVLMDLLQAKAPWNKKEQDGGGPLRPPLRVLIKNDLTLSYFVCLLFLPTYLLCICHASLTPWHHDVQCLALPAIALVARAMLHV